MFKLNSVGRKLYFSVLAVFLVFAVSFIVFQQAREKQYKIGTLTIKLENYNELLAEDRRSLLVKELFCRIASTIGM